MIKHYFLTYTPKDWLTFSCRIVLGILFIFSGFVKLLPIEPFELKFVEMGLANWQFSPYIARFIISGELLLGLFLLLNIYPKVTAWATIGTLLFFTGYLMLDLVKNGNDSNCGCFGTFIVMTPIESIVKNLLMLPFALVILLPSKAYSFYVHYTSVFLILLSIATPFVLYPVDGEQDRLNANTEKVDYPFPAHLMPDFEINGVKLDLLKGEQLVAFMSVNCLHCKKAAYKLYILNQQHKLPPIYLVLIATDELVPDFVKETKANFPFYIFLEDAFFDIAGNGIPKLFYLKEGIVKAKFDNITLTEEALLGALKR